MHLKPTRFIMPTLSNFCEKQGVILNIFQVQWSTNSSPTAPFSFPHALKTPLAFLFQTLFLPPNSSLSLSPFQICKKCPTTATPISENQSSFHELGRNPCNGFLIRSSEILRKTRLSTRRETITLTSHKIRM